MQEKINLVTAREEIRREVKLYRELLRDAEQRERDIEEQLNRTYRHEYCSEDLAQVRRDILGVIKGTTRSWSINDVAQALPQYDYRLINRQMQLMAQRGSLLRDGSRWAGSHCSTKVG